MHIALCLYGQYRNFDLTYKKIFDTFLNKDQYITDIYLSTWEEDRCLEKHIIKNINKNIYIDVEKETSKVKKGLEIFNTLYPMLYKQRRVFELTKKSSTNYDLVILLRMDIEFLNEFNINEYKPNILYIGNGYHLPNNKHNLFWRNNIYKVEEFFDIYKLDSRAGFIPNTNYVQPICDQFFIGSPNIIDTYTEMIYLLDKVMLICDNLSIYRKIL